MVDCTPVAWMSSVCAHELSPGDPDVGLVSKPQLRKFGRTLYSMDGGEMTSRLTHLGDGKLFHHVSHARLQSSHSWVAAS